jgi:hypothetical protein
MAQKNGTGMFPREVMNRIPSLPLEEEGRLNDMPLRENLIERAFAYYRLTEMLDKEATPGGLVPGKLIQGRQVPYSTQAHTHGPSSPGQAVLSITRRWAASWRMQASGTGTNLQPSMGPCSWRAWACGVPSEAKGWASGASMSTPEGSSTCGAPLPGRLWVS